MNFLFRAALICLFITGAATEIFAQQNGGEPEAKAILRSGDSVAVYSRPNIVKTNLAGLFSLFYEAQVHPKRSLQLSMNRADIGFLWDDTKYFSLIPAFKFYVSKKAGSQRRPSPSGFYISPYLRYVNVRDIGGGFFSDRKLYEVAYNLFGGGVVAGYQVIFRKGLTLDFFGGGGYLPLNSSKVIYTYTRDYEVNVSPEDYKTDIRIGLCIGYAFKRPQ